MKSSIQFLALGLLVSLLFSCQKAELIAPNATTAHNVDNNNSSIHANAIQNTDADNKNSINNKSNISTNAHIGLILKGNWREHAILTDMGLYCSDYMRPNQILSFTDNEMHLDSWLHHDGFKEMDFDPDVVNQTYDAMYQIDDKRRYLDICRLRDWCIPSNPTDNGRCGPPPFIRLKIISITNDEVVLETHALGWSKENLEYGLVPDEYRNQFAYRRF